MASPLRQLPSVNAVLELPQVSELQRQYAHERIVEAIREELALAREHLNNGKQAVPDALTVARRAAERVARAQQPNLRTVINATGIVLHTNLGRAPMAEEAARAAYNAARRYLNLELDLKSAKRSSRQDAIRNWLQQLTGAESATA